METSLYSFVNATKYTLIPPDNASKVVQSFEYVVAPPQLPLGSYEKFEGVDRLGWCGLYSDQGVSVPAYMPVNIKQANNAAKLLPLCKLCNAIFPVRLPSAQILPTFGCARSCQTLEDSWLDRVPWSGEQHPQLGRSSVAIRKPEHRA